MQDNEDLEGILQDSLNKRKYKDWENRRIVVPQELQAEYDFMEIKLEELSDLELIKLGTTKDFNTHHYIKIFDELYKRMEDKNDK